MKLFRKLKCLLGHHKGKYQAGTGQWDILKCEDCSKYYIWHSGVGCGFWTKDKSKINKDCREVIEKKLICEIGE